VWCAAATRTGLLKTECGRVRTREIPGKATKMDGRAVGRGACRRMEAACRCARQPTGEGQTTQSQRGGRAAGSGTSRRSKAKQRPEAAPPTQSLEGGAEPAGTKEG
jgi:hypothetical protein